MVKHGSFKRYYKLESNRIVVEFLGYRNILCNKVGGKGKGTRKEECT